MQIEITGVADGGCPCTGINGKHKVPIVGKTDNYCEGDLGLGITCLGIPVPGGLSWDMTCNPDGTKTINVDYELGSLTKDFISYTFDSSGDCCDISGSGVDSTGNNNCDMSGASYASIRPYGGECPEDP